MLPIILPGHLTQKGVESKPMSLPHSLPYLKVIYEKEDIKPPNLELTSWIKGQYRHDLLDPNFNCYILFRDKVPLFVLELADRLQNGTYTMNLALGLDKDPGNLSAKARNLIRILDACLNSFFELNPSVKNVEFELKPRKFEELLGYILFGAHFQMIGVRLYRRRR